MYRILQAGRDETGENLKMRNIFELPRGQVQLAMPCKHTVFSLIFAPDFYRKVPVRLRTRVWSDDPSDDPARPPPLRVYQRHQHVNCNHDAAAQGHMFLFPDYVCFDSRLIARETTIAMPYAALAQVHLPLDRLYWPAAPCATAYSLFGTLHFDSL